MSDRRLLIEAALAGLLGALAFPLAIPGVGEGPLLDAVPRELGIFAAAALLFRVTRHSAPLRLRMRAGFIGGLVYFGVLLFWLVIAMRDYGHLPWWLATVLLFLLIAYCALYWGALPAVVDLVRRFTPLPTSLAFAAAVVALEWARGHWLTGFPWGLWGYALVRNTPVVQWASFVGVHGLSFLVAITGAWLIEYLEARRTPKALPKGLAVLAAFALPYAAGLQLMREPSSGSGLRVAALQGGTDEHAAHDKKHVDGVLATHESLARDAALRHAELIVWPEAAWPRWVSREALTLPEAAVGVPSIVGAPVYDYARDVGANSALALDGAGAILGRYDKMHLVPFGEYVPLAGLLPLDKLVPAFVENQPGASHAPLAPYNAGVLICYDGLFPEIAREHVRAGAEFLVNITNDAWYGASSAPYQHRDFYVLRAVETRRWIVRAANTGVSLFMDPYGRAHEATRLGETTFAMADIEPRNDLTFYVKAGDLVGAASLGLVLGAAARALVKRLAARRAKAP